MHTATMLWAAEYVCYIHERWCKLQEFDTYHGRYTEMRSPWWLNTLTEARLDRIPPWGTPGYAYVPADLRKARGAPNLASICAQSQCYLLVSRHVLTGLQVLDAALVDRARGAG